MGEEMNTVGTAAEGAEDEGGGFLEGWEDTAPAEGAVTDGDGDAGDRGAREETRAEGAEDVPGGERAGGGSGEGEQNGEDRAGQPRQAPPRTWTLSHMGQPVTAGERDMVTLAQKGLDYDRVRGEYEAARPVMDLFRDFAGKAGMEVPAYLAHIRAQAKQAEGMSEADARRAVDLEDREAALEAKEARERAQREAAALEASRRQAEDARMQADIREFAETFPEAAQDPRSIPREVWDAVRSGRSLVSAYAMYSQAQARAEAEHAQAAARQNEQNAARSAGSMRSNGAGSRSDPFLEGFES